MSKSLTVRLTLRRSSARTAPISYTPPVKPPPPSTNAVRERRSRRRCCFLPEERFGPGGPLGVASSSTTSPIGVTLYSRNKVARRKVRGPFPPVGSPRIGAPPRCRLRHLDEEAILTTLSARIELGQFFQETSDPALQESADRSLLEELAH